MWHDTTVPQSKRRKPSSGHQPPRPVPHARRVAGARKSNANRRNAEVLRTGTADSRTLAPSPVPIVRQVTKGWAQDKLNKGIDGTLAALLAASILAARATSGALRLSFGVLVFAAFIGLGQALGARLASKGSRVGFVFFLSAKWWLIATLVLLRPILGLAGIPNEQSLRMLVGAAFGLGVVFSTWLGWLLLARRRPDLLYLPGSLPRWWLRGTMLAGGMVGIVVALALGWP